MSEEANSPEVPVCESLARDLVAACHLQDRDQLERVVARINTYGWHRGVAHSMHYAFIAVLSVAHVGDLQTPFSDDLVSKWQQEAVVRHGRWLLVPGGLVRDMINVAKEGVAQRGNVPANIVTLRQAMLLETLVSTIAKGDESDYGTVLEAGFVKAREVIRHCVESGELRFEPHPGE